MACDHHSVTYGTRSPCSTICNARELHVGVGTVRRIAPPISQRERRSRTVAASCGFDIGVAVDGDSAAGAESAAGAGDRGKLFARVAGQTAVAFSAALLA